MLSLFAVICLLLGTQAKNKFNNQTKLQSNVGPIMITEDGVQKPRYVVSGTPDLAQVNGATLTLEHGAQVQIAKNGSDSYGPYIFMEYKLSGKTLSYTVDLSQISCSCNAALYLVTMPGIGSNGQPDAGQYGDYYCDANDVGGQWCWEMDVMEANQYVTAATPHSCDQDPGTYITNCDRGGCGTNSHDVNGGGMCPGGCIINTQQPFQYSITFGNTYHVKMTQNGQTFEFDACNDGGYIGNENRALGYGMVMVMSYWGTDWQTMSWLDQNTGCSGDCDQGGRVVFSNIAIG